MLKIEAKMVAAVLTGGCNTPTMRSRVNALLQGLEVPGRVYSVKGQAHFNGKPINHHDWVQMS